ncbi:MAG: hypothetical protein AAGF11_18120 [Myxococcota bacterium]
MTAKDIQPPVVHGTGTTRTTITTVATATPIPDAAMLADYKKIGGEDLMLRVFEQAMESWRDREAMERKIVEHQIDMDRQESKLRHRSSENFSRSRQSGMWSALTIALSCVALVAYGLYLGRDFWAVGWALLIVSILAAVLLNQDKSPVRALSEAIKAIRGRGRPKQLELFRPDGEASDEP